MLAPKLSEGLGQQFYVENHPGGSGNIGTALAAKAPPDGYTILVISSTLVVNPSLFAKLGFDTTIVALPDVRERLSALGFEPIASTPKEFADRIRWEIDKWAKVIRAANIKAQ